MEKTTIIKQLSLGRVATNLFAVLALMRSPNIIWRIILSAVIGIILAIAGFASFALRWATSEKTLLVPGKRGEAFSIEEMKKVASFYEERRRRFEELKYTPQVPPSFERGVGPVAPKAVSGERATAAGDEEMLKTPLSVSGDTSGPIEFAP